MIRVERTRIATAALAVGLMAGLILPASAQQSISPSSIRVTYVDSEETTREDGEVKNAFDGNTRTKWHTAYSSTRPAFPHEIRLDLGSSYQLSQFSYLPRQDKSTNGQIHKFELHVSTNGSQWARAIVSAFDMAKTEKRIQIQNVTARYVKIVALSEISGQAFASAAEFGFAGSKVTTDSSTPSEIPVSSAPPPSSVSDDPVDWASLIASSYGTRYVVSSAGQFNAVSAIAQPGDVILVADGVYDWGALQISSRGTKEQPIIYTARNPGRVVFQNMDRAFVITGSNNIIGGFTMRNIRERVAQFTGNSGAGTVGASNNRLTDNVIIESGARDATQGCPCWMLEIDKRSHNNRIDHNLFARNYGHIRVRLDDEALAYGPSQYTRVDHNVFTSTLGHRMPVMQIGNCAACTPGSELLAAKAIFEHNLITRHDTGYEEIVSNKSSGNVIRNNTFDKVFGGIEIRMGNNVTISGNYFNGGGSTAIGASGAYHLIQGNTIEAPGRHTGIVVWRWGSRPSAQGAALLDTHHITVDGNYINGGSLYALRFNDCSAEACKTIRDSVVRANILQNSKGELFRYNPSGALNISINGNTYVRGGDAAFGVGYSWDRSPSTIMPSSLPRRPPLPVLSPWADAIRKQYL